MTRTANVLYTAKVHTTGGREGGASQSNDGHLDVKFTTPGTAGAGTNPEQLFAAGWSACFLSALHNVARKMKIELPQGASIDAEVDLTTTSGYYDLVARLNIDLPGLERDLAQTLIDSAQQLCPYSKAVRGNIDATVRLV